MAVRKVVSYPTRSDLLSSYTDFPPGHPFILSIEASPMTSLSGREEDMFDEDLGHLCGAGHLDTGPKRRRLTVDWCVSHFPHHCDQGPEKKQLKRGEHSFGSQFKGIQSIVVGKMWRQKWL